MSNVRIINGDCLDIIPKLAGFDFVFADPPFNIGQDYEGFKDQRPEGEYRDWTFEWIEACWKKCDGVMALHGPDNLAALYLEAERRLEMPRIAWVNWHYRFGQCRRTNWIDARCHCLIFAQNPIEYTWNPEAVLVESDRASKYNDKRIDDTERGGQRLPGTVWGIPSDGPNWGRVQGTNNERRHGHPNQLPERYLERLIRAYTNEGDRVLDPFGGSGTTATVAMTLGRSCTTIDISESSTGSIKDRVRYGSIRITE